MSAKMSIVGDGFAELAERLDEITNDIKPAVDEALKRTHAFITPNLDEAMNKHNRTYKTVNSLIKENAVSWETFIATIDVGFRIREGGLASIFLMYGTPRMKKDTKLYNAIRGTKTKKTIYELQNDVMVKHINLAKKG